MCNTFSLFMFQNNSISQPKDSIHSWYKIIILVQYEHNDNSQELNTGRNPM